MGGKKEIAMKLPYKRFVKQVSNKSSISRYAYVGMMNSNADTLKDEPWHEAECDPKDVSLTVAQITRTDGKFDSVENKWAVKPTYTAYIDDKYDVFAQSGDGVKSIGTMCGYAGCVAYRFTLPDNNISSLFISGMDICLMRDRYIRAGLRISVAVSNDINPSNNWGEIRNPNTAISAVSYNMTPAELFNEITYSGVDINWDNYRFYIMKKPNAPASDEFEWLLFALPIGGGSVFSLPSDEWPINAQILDVNKDKVVAGWGETKGPIYIGGGVIDSNGVVTFSSGSAIKGGGGSQEPETSDGYPVFGTPITTKPVRATLNGDRFVYVTSSTPCEGNIKGVASWGFLGQPNVPNLLEGRAEGGNLTITNIVATYSRYLYVYITLEDPSAYWEMYNSTEKRFYYIEGSAMLVPSLGDFRIEDISGFEGQVAAPSSSDGWEDANSYESQWLWKTIMNKPDYINIVGDIYKIQPISMMYSRFVEIPMSSILRRLTAGKLAFEGSDPGPEDFGIIASLSYDGIRTPEAGMVQFAVDAINYNEKHFRGASLYYCEFIVPCSRMQYSKIKVSVSDVEGDAAYVEDVGFDINIWKVASPDATGPYDWLVFCALAENPAFFNASMKSVSAAFASDQSLPDLSAKAQFIGSFNFEKVGDAYESQIIDVGILKPGEIVVMSPNIMIDSPNYLSRSCEVSMQVA